MSVPYVNLGVQFDKDDLLLIQERTQEILLKGAFILGTELDRFESQFAELCGTKYAVGVANGTDALILALKAIGLKTGQEVITASNSFFASASSIVLAGGIPVLVDVSEDYNIDPDQIEKAITSKTKAIIPVHLYGNPAKMDEIKTLAKKYNLIVIEDAAQAVGASYKNQAVGSIGHLGCFSLHPLKNLGAAGDAGIITTNNEAYYNYLRKARNHGLKNRDECEFVSLNSRLDNLQAMILNVKMKHVREWNEKRIQNARYYSEELSDLVEIPKIPAHVRHVYHAYVIQVENRSKLIEHLDKLGIQTKIHYPIPIHLQAAMKDVIERPLNLSKTEKQMDRILSLPIYPELTKNQLKEVVDGIKSFYA